MILQIIMKITHIFLGNNILKYFISNLHRTHKITSKIFDCRATFTELCSIAVIGTTYGRLIVWVRTNTCTASDGIFIAVHAHSQATVLC